MTLDHTFKTKISIVAIWLFTVSGFIGIMSSARDWFLSLTPLNLLLYFFATLWCVEKINTKVVLALSIPFFLGFITEALGVNYGLIFGTYAYGENLGFKVVGVPVMICVNWALLTLITADISKLVAKHLILRSAIGAALMTALDLILEVSAPRFDFWEFENNVVPVQNYIGWFVIAFVAHLGYQKFNIKTSSIISWHIFIAITLFFAIFAML